MPYSIRKDGDKYDVIKKSTGETVSTHTSHRKAVKAVKAIYAHEHSEGKQHNWFRH